MTAITLAQPQVFDPSSSNGDWIRTLLGGSGRFTVQSATADKVVLAVTDPAFTGYTIAITPAGHFSLTPGAALPFSGAMDSVVLLDHDGGTAGLAESLPATATLADLGNGAVLALAPLQVYGSDGADTVVGLAGGDLLSGAGGADLLRGGAGDDTLQGGAGGDTLAGGDGSDRIYADATDHIDGGAGYDQVYLTQASGAVEAWFDQAAPAGGLRIDGVEAVIVNDAGSRLHGGAAAETFIGGAGRDVFEGAGGGDILAGLTGDDELHGGAGDDILDGGVGTDLLDGGAGFDLADYSTAGGSVVVDLRITGVQQTALGPDTLVSIEGVIGGNYNDTLTGAASDDTLMGSGGDDLLDGGAGSDFLLGGLGADRLLGGAGADTLAEISGSNYLRGGDGDDVIAGGVGFDDANGNEGNDSISTSSGDDYAVGGKGDDLLAGDAGADLVWGNLGNDTCDGGDGNDQVRGGQGDDLIAGGAGDDFVSGDRGADTVAGGQGADLFHGSQDCGIDRLIDFHSWEGDRVLLDSGTTYTVNQVGADTVIDMGAGNQMILVGVNLSTLPDGWIVGA